MHRETDEGLYYIKMRYRYKDHKGEFHRQTYFSIEDLEQVLRPTSWSLNEVIDSDGSATYVAIIGKE